MRKVNVRIADHNMNIVIVVLKPRFIIVLERPVHKCILLHEANVTDQGNPLPGNQ